MGTESHSHHPDSARIPTHSTLETWLEVKDEIDRLRAFERFFRLPMRMRFRGAIARLLERLDSTIGGDS